MLKLNELDKAIDILHEGLIICEKRPVSRSYVKDAITTQLGLAYILSNNLTAAEPILKNLVERSPESPEIVHAYSYLLVSRDGKERAEEAYKRFRQVSPRSWKQKALYNLFYGLYLLELDKTLEANDHFALAHKYEINNVYIMVKYANTLFKLAFKSKADGEPNAVDFAKRCGQICNEILKYDPKNAIVDSLRVDLGYEFGIELSKLASEA